MSNKIVFGEHYPYILYENIFSHLNPKDILSLREVSFELKQASEIYLSSIFRNNIQEKIVQDFLLEAFAERTISIIRPLSFQEHTSPMSISALRTLITFLKIIDNSRHLINAPHISNLSCHATIMTIRDKVIPKNKELFELNYSQVISDKEGLLTFNTQRLNFSMIPLSKEKVLKLAKFTLENSSVSEIPFLGDSPNLESLFISRSPLLRLPHTLGKSLNLKSITINNTLLKSVPNTLKNEQRDVAIAETLDLAFNDIRELPANINHSFLDVFLNGNKNLKTTCRELSYVNDDDSAFLDKMSTIFIEGERIHSDPNYLGVICIVTYNVSIYTILRTWNQLNLIFDKEVLDASNKLSIMEKSISKLHQATFQNVTYLDWGGLNLVTLPTYYEKFPNLKVLDISDNLFLTAFQIINKWKNKNPHLETIILSETPYLQDSKTYIEFYLKRKIPSLKNVIFKKPNHDTFAASFRSSLALISAEQKQTYDFELKTTKERLNQNGLHSSLEGLRREDLEKRSSKRRKGDG